MSVAPSISNPYLVAGQVFNPYTGVVADAAVDFSAETTKGVGFGSIRTDANGQFAMYAPESAITVYVDKPGFVQQCAARTDVRGDIALQVELTTVGTLLNTSAPRPQSATGPSLSGTVFELTNGVRRPIAGAAFRLEYYDDRAAATTQSDLEGNYFLCNLTQPATLYVTKLGYQTATFRIHAATATLDVELTLR